MRLKQAVDYQPYALFVFQEVKQQLTLSIRECRIEHIGASAIPHAVSKGDLDICVIVNKGALEQTRCILLGMGYAEQQDTLRTEQLCMLVSPRTDIDLAIQIIEQGSEFEFFVQFRDILIANPQLVLEYNDLKEKNYKLDEDKYRQLKSEFIERILKPIVP